MQHYNRGNGQYTAHQKDLAADGYRFKCLKLNERILVAPAQA